MWSKLELGLLETVEKIPALSPVIRDHVHARLFFKSAPPELVPLHLNTLDSFKDDIVSAFPALLDHTHPRELRHQAASLSGFHDLVVRQPLVRDRFYPRVDPLTGGLFTETTYLAVNGDCRAGLVISWNCHRNFPFGLTVWSDPTGHDLTTCEISTFPNPVSQCPDLTIPGSHYNLLACLKGGKTKRTYWLYLELP